MRVTNGSAVSTASTPPDLMMSAMVGKVTSTKLTPLGSTPFSTSHFTNSTCRKALRPGAPTFLPTKSFGSLMVMPLRTKAVMLPFETGLMTDGAGNGDEVEAAVDGLQEHGRGRAADLDRVRQDRGRNVRVDADRRHLDFKPVLFEDAFVDRDHGGGAIRRRGAADLDLGLRQSGAGQRQR